MILIHPLSCHQCPSHKDLSPFQSLIVKISHEQHDNRLSAHIRDVTEGPFVTTRTGDAQDGCGRLPQL